jgi:hypothetical protein
MCGDQTKENSKGSPADRVIPEKSAIPEPPSAGEYSIWENSHWENLMAPEPKAEHLKKPTVFDRTGEFTIPIRLARKSVTVRFPTDEQLSRRQGMIRITLKRHGMEGTITDVSGEERADAELLAAIKLSGDDMDGAEATVVVERLLKAEAEEPQKEGDEYLIPITVIGSIRTTHRLREPTMAELRNYDRSARKRINGPHGTQIKSSPSAVGSFYDKLIVESMGYVGEVPVCHKMVAIYELVAAIERVETEDDPENFS